MILTHFNFNGHEVPIYYCGSLGNTHDPFLGMDSRVSNYYNDYFSKYSWNQICLFSRAYDKLSFDFKRFKGSIFVNWGSWKIMHDNSEGIFENYCEIIVQALKFATCLKAPSNFEDFVNEAFSEKLGYVNRMRSIYGNNISKWEDE